MENNEFWSLYDSGTIKCKIFEAKWEDGKCSYYKCIEAFEYGGKFWMRLHNRETWDATCHDRKGRAYHHKFSNFWNQTKIKEFDTKAQANNYFKKFFEGCSYEKVMG